MAAPKGNKYKLRLKTPELRQLAYKQYCEHISSGMPLRCWYFQHPELSLGWETMEKYIRDYNDLDPKHKEEALAKKYEVWFKKGIEMMEGRVDKCQPAIYQMIMRNIFGWDKEKTLQKDSSESLVKRITNAWREKTS